MYHSRINLFIISSIIAILWLVPFGTGHGLFAKDTARIVSKRVIDVCGQRKDKVVLVIDLGKIVKKDSLFGCNFQLSYDTTKLRFHSALYLNTLAEFFEFKQVGFIRTGKIIGAVATMGMRPVYGSRPLVGFLGDYLDSCSNSVEVKIDYLEFTDEFKKEYVYSSGHVVGRVKDKTERYFKLSADKDTTFILQNENEGLFKIKAEQGIDYNIIDLIVSLKLNNFDNYIIKNIKSAEPSLLEIKKIKKTDNSVNISFFVKGKLNNKDIAVINIAEKRKGEEVAEILIEALAINSGCSCFTHKFSDLTYVKSRKKIDGVNDNSNKIKNDYYSMYSNEWIIEMVKQGLTVEIYDILGNLMVRKNCDFGISRISLDGFSNGVYFGIIQYSNNVIKKKIFIKN